MVYLSLILDYNLYKVLWLSVEGNLAKGILGSQEKLHRHPEVQEVFELFYRLQYQPILVRVTTEQ